MKMSYTPALLGLALLAGCTTMPSGPSVMALPGSGRSFEQFRFDDSDCQMYAQSQLGGASASSAATESAVRSAAIGTAIGAVAGAAIGGSRNVGAGAGTGLVVGSVAGAGSAGASGYTLQQRFDNAYVQCMYAKGHKVPVAGRFVAPENPPPARPASVPPPPPPGSPPPPPPGLVR